MSRDEATERPRGRDLIVADIVARTGIDEAMIERLVRSFYGRARRDPLLGPIFDGTVQDWERHITRICAFWSSVALMSGRYHGQPMVAHLPLPVDTPHFDRWLALFAATADEVCPAPGPSGERRVRIGFTAGGKWIRTSGSAMRSHREQRSPGRAA